MSESKKFINLIATLDLEAGAGAILFVNPLLKLPAGSELAAVAGAPVAQGAAAGAVGVSSARYELSVENSAGVEVARYRPNIRQSHCEVRRPSDSRAAAETLSAPTENSTKAMINAFLPVLSDMKRIILLRDGAAIAKFEPGPASAPSVASRGLAMAAATDGASHRRSLAAAGAAGPELGVSYTVQVMPQDANAWQTIAVGRPTPAIQLDRNQFPGAKTARVRILRNTGFADEVFAEEDVRLDF